MSARTTTATSTARSTRTSKLVSPGFIDTHIHSGHRAAHRLITDAGRPEYFGQPFFETLPARRGRPHGGDAGDWVKRADEDEAAARRRIDAATYTIAELLRNGTTTFMDFGAQLPMQQALLAESERLGIRAYLAPAYASADWVGGEDGRLVRDWDEEKGRRGLRAAVDFIGEHVGAGNGRIRGILIPFTTELMSAGAAARDPQGGGLAWRADFDPRGVQRGRVLPDRDRARYDTDRAAGLGRALRIRCADRAREFRRRESAHEPPGRARP